MVIHMFFLSRDRAWSVAVVSGSGRPEDVEVVNEILPDLTAGKMKITNDFCLLYIQFLAYSLCG